MKWAKIINLYVFIIVFIFVLTVPLPPQPLIDRTGMLWYWHDCYGWWHSWLNVFQLASCLSSRWHRAWRPQQFGVLFFFVYVHIKIHVVCEIRAISQRENILSAGYYWHHAVGILAHTSELPHKYFIKSPTSSFFFISSQSPVGWWWMGTCNFFHNRTSEGLTKVEYLGCKID